MQVKKNDIQNRILLVAKSEFVEKSFQQSSMRSIAKKVGVTPSNIYNYFKNKDEIFITILAPLLNKIEYAKEKFVEFESKHDENHEETFAEHIKAAKKVGKFINENREDLKLLAFNSIGSILENYDNDLIDWVTEAMKKSFSSKVNHSIDEFVAHITISVWVNAIKEILMHNISEERTY